MHRHFLRLILRRSKMNFIEFLIEQMEENGLSLAEAENEIMPRIMMAKENESFKDRWLNDIENFPIGVRTVLWISAKRHALEWIDENVPSVWYRVLFIPADEADQAIKALDTPKEN